MHVEAAVRGYSQNFFGENKAVGGNNNHVGFELPDEFGNSGSAQGRWLVDREAKAAGKLLYGGGGRFLTAAGGLIRPGEDARNLVTPVPQTLKGREGKFRGTHKDDAHSTQRFYRQSRGHATAGGFQLAEQVIREAGAEKN